MSRYENIRAATGFDQKSPGSWVDPGETITIVDVPETPGIFALGVELAEYGVGLAMNALNAIRAWRNG